MIITDAIRLRIYMGDQSHSLNLLTKELQLDQKKFPRLKERIGHTQSEIIAGAFVGFCLSLLFIRWWS